jgi:hypothetical protein
VRWGANKEYHVAHPKQAKERKPKNAGSDTKDCTMYSFLNLLLSANTYPRKESRIKGRSSSIFEAVRPGLGTSSEARR